MTLPATPTPSFDVFLKYDALTRLLFDYADAHPTLVSVDSIGKSHEGRDIWVATVTNTATGVAADKPAFWADGNIHAARRQLGHAPVDPLHQRPPRLIHPRRHRHRHRPHRPLSRGLLPRRP